jgi:hypothetical protein
MAILLQCLTFHNALLVFHQFHAFHTSIGNNFLPRFAKDWNYGQNTA